MSQILNCNIDKETMSICVSLLENGANPEALATIMKDIKTKNNK